MEPMPELTQLERNLMVGVKRQMGTTVTEAQLARRVMTSPSSVNRILSGKQRASVVMWDRLMRAARELSSKEDQ